MIKSLIILICLLLTRASLSKPRASDVTAAFPLYYHTNAMPHIPCSAPRLVGLV